MTKTLVISYNLDMHQPYVYDLSSDHEYRPYVEKMTFTPDEKVYVDDQSFSSSTFSRLGLDSYPRFCLLEEFYFFRTILETEARSPTVVLHPDRPYDRLLTFAEFLEWFSKTYKIIYARWRSLEPSVETPEESPSMRYLFQVSNESNDVLTFREWMNRVNRTDRIT